MNATSESVWRDASPPADINSEIAALGIPRGSMIDALNSPTRDRVTKCGCRWPFSTPSISLMRPLINARISQDSHHAAD
jgi:hypothetical protein